MADGGQAQAPLFQPTIKQEFWPVMSWEPDRWGTGYDNQLEVRNCWPHPDGYRSFEYSNTIDRSTGAPSGTVNDGIAITRPNGDRFVYASTATKLHRYQPTNNYSDLTGATSNGPWVFTKYGDLVIATSLVAGGDPPQKQDSTGAGAFANLGGTPPNAYLCCVVRDFLVLARTSANPYRVYWSALGNPEDWTVAAATQCDFQDLSAEGPIQAIVGGDYGLVFFKNAIYRMDYIGSPAIFSFTKISNFGAIGLTGGGAVPQAEQACRLGDNTYFIGQDALSVVIGGQSAKPVMLNRCRDFVSSDGIIGGFKMRVGTDPYRRHAVLFYRDVGSVVSTVTSRAIFYDEVLDKFSFSQIDAECLFPAMVEEFGSTATTITSTMTYYDGNHRHSTLLPLVDGAATSLKPTVPVGERQIFGGHRAVVRNLIPNVESPANILLAAGSRSVYSDSISFASSIGINAEGNCPFRKEGRYHCAKFSSITAGPTGGRIFRGVTAESVQQGLR